MNSPQITDEMVDAVCQVLWDGDVDWITACYLAKWDRTRPDYCIDTIGLRKKVRSALAEALDIQPSPPTSDANAVLANELADICAGDTVDEDQATAILRAKVFIEDHGLVFPTPSSRIVGHISPITEKVAEGWVLAPKIETDEMCEAGLEALRENLGHTAVIARDVAACYRAMIAAATSSEGKP